eukprot:365697-Chlamydomonas_euryale.AAC.2
MDMHMIQADTLGQGRCKVVYSPQNRAKVQSDSLHAPWHRSVEGAALLRQKRLIAAPASVPTMDRQPACPQWTETHTEVSL